MKKQNVYKVTSESARYKSFHRKTVGREQSSLLLEGTNCFHLATTLLSQLPMNAMFQKRISPPFTILPLPSPQSKTIASTSKNQTILARSGPAQMCMHPSPNVYAPTCACAATRALCGTLVHPSPRVRMLHACSVTLNHTLTSRCRCAFSVELHGSGTSPQLTLRQNVSLPPCEYQKNRCK